MSSIPEKHAILQILNRYVPEVLEMMAGVKAVPGGGDESAPDTTELEGIAGAIGLSGKVSGIVYTAFSDDLARMVAGKIMGGEAGEQEMCDVVGELTNMITGNLKSRLCDMGFNCSLSIPSVVAGKKIRVRANTAQMSISNEYRIEGCPDPLKLQVFAVLDNQ
jgi:CheY-specific phosphatase CheX